MTLPTTRWRPLIEEACRYAHPVPSDVLEAMVLVESNGNPNARSASNAIGLGQVIPRWHERLIREVASHLSMAFSSLEEALRDPELNLWVSARHLKWCYGECGTREAAVAKYHSGQCHPPADFVDGQGTSTVKHLVKFREALQRVKEDRMPDRDDVVGDIIDAIEDITEGTPAMPTKLNMDKGLIPLPKHERKIVGAKNTGVSWVGQRTIRGDTIHRMQGSFVSAFHHFSNPNVASLTDWGLDHMSGTLWLYNDPKGTRTGWASGPYKGGYGDGRAFAEKYIPRMGIGAEVINRDRESVEISGYFRQPGSSVSTDSPWSEASMRVLAQLHASRAHDYGIAWGDYPIARPTDDFSFLAWHQEFILPEYSTESWDKVCPGREVMEQTSELIEITRGIMKSYQEVSEPTPEQPAEPEPGLLLYPQGMDAAIAAAAFGRVKGDDGREYGFDERGPVSRLWLDIGWAGGDASRFPELVSVQHVEGHKYFRFSDGLLIWQPSADEAVRVIGSEAPDDRAA